MKKYDNNSFRITDINKEVTVHGWVSKKRNLGGLIFIDLRDRSGIVQLVVKPEDSSYEIAESLRNEYVIEVTGVVSERESKNKNIATGDIEIIVSNINIINTCCDLPFEISDNTSALEDTRLKYRYLDLRRNSIQNNLKIRNKVCLIARNYLSDLGFIEYETPILCKSTPEGARDYLVPSRVNKGKFYALPQSPQIFKQLLMIGGVEKYFQIARCFRDEDLRADRQPEFTQIDIEMSFAGEEDIWGVTEGLMSKVFEEIKGIKLDKFPRITYKECMSMYGSDKPDTRFDLKLNDITEIFKDTEFTIFKNIIESNGIINGIVGKGLASKLSRKDLDKLTEFVKIYGASALSYLKYNEGEFTGSIAKVLTDKEKEDIKTTLNIEEDDIIFVIADKQKIVYAALGALRLKLAKDFDLIDDSKYNFLWVTNFPMFEFSEEENRFVAAHHPFTAPNKEDVDKLINDKANCYSRAYDLVLNGYELLSGSVRIHDEETQSKVFEAIGMTIEEAKEKFGFFLEAFKFGAPNHCGVGIGLERLIMILVGTDNIRDVVAFPKTASATCLMSDAPNLVDNKQLKELKINLEK